MSSGALNHLVVAMRLFSSLFNPCSTGTFSIGISSLEEVLFFAGAAGWLGGGFVLSAAE